MDIQYASRFDQLACPLLSIAVLPKSALSQFHLHKSRRRCHVWPHPMYGNGHVRMMVSEYLGIWCCIQGNDGGYPTTTYYQWHDAG